MYPLTTIIIRASVLTLTVIRPPCLQVWNLETNKTYMFRVRAENRYGKSEPCATKEVQITDPFGLPGPPEKPEITEYCKTSMTLKWEPPRDSGGSMIIGYWLEKREKGSDYWARVNKMPITKRGVKGWEYQVSSDLLICNQKHACLSGMLTRLCLTGDSFDRRNRVRVQGCCLQFSRNRTVQLSFRFGLCCRPTQ